MTDDPHKQEADDDKQARRQRAARLRDRIEELRRGDPSAHAPTSPREFTDRAAGAAVEERRTQESERVRGNADEPDHG